MRIQNFSFPFIIASMKILLLVAFCLLPFLALKTKADPGWHHKNYYTKVVRWNILCNINLINFFIRIITEVTEDTIVTKLKRCTTTWRPQWRLHPRSTTTEGNIITITATTCLPLQKQIRPRIPKLSASFPLQLRLQEPPLRLLRQIPSSQPPLR